MNTENTGKKDERNLYLKNKDLNLAVSKYLALLSFAEAHQKGRVLPVIEAQGWAAAKYRRPCGPGTLTLRLSAKLPIFRCPGLMFLTQRRAIALPPR